MKTLYTSYYARSGEHPDAIAISASSPTFFKGGKYLKLAPTWDLLRKYKSGEIGETSYIEEYIKLLEQRTLTPQKVLDDLKNGSILLCYEGPGKFCHRHIVAEWIESDTDATVLEIEPKNVRGLVDEVFGF